MSISNSTFYLSITYVSIYLSTYLPIYHLSILPIDAKLSQGKKKENISDKKQQERLKPEKLSICLQDCMISK